MTVSRALSAALAASLLMALMALMALPLAAQEPLSSASLPEIRIARSAGPIEVDGSLGDPGWQGAATVDTFWETAPGDNAEPKVKTLAYLAYDDRYLYVGFDFSDPDPARIKAPLGDRDNISVSNDYGGVILDTRNDGKTAVELLVTAGNIQYDAVQIDGGGEDSSLDLYWDSATRITDKGWNLEIRIPFSSLRYSGSGPQTWGILLYRSYPREFRYNILSTLQTKNSKCFLCNERKLVGLEGLPTGKHLVLAPYATAGRASAPGGPLGSPLDDSDDDYDAGLDAKWTPTAGMALDATINPDFSQVESDVAQISANERFALFFPEKRPFFLEGLELFSTPLSVVYTRTITSPRWGARATGELGGNAYTLLVADDRGGGSVILPGAEFSQLAPQDFGATSIIGRVRHDIGRSFVSMVLTDRENDGGGHNRVVGPDVLWRPNDHDRITAQLLVSDTENPDRPDLFPGWNGESLRSHAFHAEWFHGSRDWDWDFFYKDLGDGFRADLGFLPQVGVRDAHIGLGHPIWSDGKITKTRPYFSLRQVRDRDDELVYQWFFFGIEWAGPWNLFFEIHPLLEKTRVAGEVLSSNKMTAHLEVNPPGLFEQVGFDIRLGDEIDVAGARPGKGGYADVHGTARAGDHLEMVLNYTRRWSELDRGPREGDRLFMAEVARIKATWTFTSRAFLRLIGQDELFESDPSLYPFPIPKRDEAFSASALFAYKLNWQTVLFLGYGDDRTFFAPTDRLEKSGRQLFLKVSYAFQR
jgi:hypothetical protein